MSKIVYQTNPYGYFVKETEADESPLEPGVYHIPGGCVEIAPDFPYPKKKWPKWDGLKWNFVDVPKEVSAKDVTEVSDDSLDKVAKLTAKVNSFDAQIQALLDINKSLQDSIATLTVTISTMNEPSIPTSADTIASEKAESSASK